MSCCAPLSDEERTTLTEYLRQAEAAYNSLMTGGMVREFRDQNGEQITYTASNPARLMSYINQLRFRLGMAPMCGVVMRPAGVFL